MFLLRDPASGDHRRQGIAGVLSGRGIGAESLHESLYDGAPPRHRQRRRQDDGAAAECCLKAQKGEQLLAHVRIERMGLVDDHHFRAGAQEVVPAPIALDEVEADDRERVRVEHTDGVGQVPLQARGPCGGNGHGRKREFGFQFRRPLLDKVRRAQHGEALDFAPVEKFSYDQPGFDGLAEADLVGEERLPVHLEERAVGGVDLVFDDALTGALGLYALNENGRLRRIDIQPDPQLFNVLTASTAQLRSQAGIARLFIFDETPGDLRLVSYGDVRVQ